MRFIPRTDFLLQQQPYTQHSGLITMLSIVANPVILQYRTRKPCYHKDDHAMRPIYALYGCPEKFRKSLASPTVILFSKLLMGFCCDRSYESAYKI